MSGACARMISGGIVATLIACGVIIPTADATFDHVIVDDPSVVNDGDVTYGSVSLDDNRTRPAFGNDDGATSSRVEEPPLSEELLPSEEPVAESLTGDNEEVKVLMLKSVRRGNRFFVSNDFKGGNAAIEFMLGNGNETAYTARLK